MAPPNEEAILKSYLLTPGQLPAIISLSDFTALFPKSQQGSPHIRALYRDLQRQRNAAVDSVSANIDAEVARGKVLRREAARARREAGSQDADPELELEISLFGSISDSGAQKHNLTSVVQKLEGAAEILDLQIRSLEEEEAKLLESAKHVVGSLSDLRYGRLSNGKLRDQVLEGLGNVQETCERRT